MTVARNGHSALLLPNGKVLILGGGTNQVEIYDPDTGTFTAASSLILRGSPTAAMLLSNGKALVVGQDLSGAGINNPGDITFATYDSETGASRDIGACHGAGLFGSATMLADGRALVASFYYGVLNLFDPAVGSCASTNSGALALFGPAAPLTTGEILFTGAQDDPGATSDAKLYDPTTAIVSSTGSLTTARADHVTTLLSDGHLLVAGAQVGSGNTLASAEVYDPVTGLSSATGPMNTSRCCGATATLLPDGDVLVAGGIHNDACCGTGPATASAEVYHPAVSATSPRLFFIDGSGQGAIWHADTGQLATVNSPASAGQILSMYTTSLIAGSVLPPHVSVGGRSSEILFFGEAPGYPGYYQVNFRLPAGVMAGLAVPVRLDYLARPSNQVTIAGDPDPTSPTRSGGSR
jgi:hypothetical protein